MKAHAKALLSVGIVLLVVAGCALYWNFKIRPNAESPVASRGVEQLPEFTVLSLDGRTLKTADYKGKLLIINFWASWCGPCIEEVPSFIRLANEMKGDLEILAVSNDWTRQDIGVFLKSFPDFQRPGITIVDDVAAGLVLSKMFKVFQLPESFVFDPSGKMVRKVMGAINWSSPEALEYLRGLKQKK